MWCVMKCTPDSAGGTSAGSGTMAPSKNAPQNQSILSKMWTYVLLIKRSVAIANDYVANRTRKIKLTAVQKKYVTTWGESFVRAVNTILPGFKTWLGTLHKLGLIEDLWAPNLVFVWMCLVSSFAFLRQTPGWLAFLTPPIPAKNEKAPKGPKDCSGAHAPHLAAQQVGLDVITTHACDYAAGPQKFAHRNIKFEVYHADLFEKDGCRLAKAFLRPTPVDSELRGHLSGSIRHQRDHPR